MLLFINNFFNIERKKKKLFKKLVKKLWLVLKLNIFFIISKKILKKIRATRLIAGRGLIRSEPKKPQFKRAGKTKDLTLNFFRLNGPTRGPPARLTALGFSTLTTLVKLVPLNQMLFLKISSKMV